MPLILSDWRRRAAAGIAATAAAIACAAPAQAATLSNPDNCAPSPTLSQPFSGWSDFASYTRLSGGHFETGAAGWTLTRAAVVDGNEPFNLGGAGAHSLNLPAGASAVSAPICIDPTYPFYRLVARNTGDRASALHMEVLFLDAKGNIKSSKSLDYHATTTAWAPTGAAPINVFTAKTTVSAAPIALRFTSMGKGNWQIDDVFVDPYMRH